TTVNPGATLLIESEAPIAAPILVGWVQVTSSTPLSGFTIFRQRTAAGDSEGTAPLDYSSTSTLVLPFDNTGGFLTGLALVNSTNSAAIINATILDDTGAQIGLEAVSLPALGHTALFLSQGFSETTGKRGMVQFQNTGGGAITAVGLRFSSFGSF